MDSYVNDIKICFLSSIFACITVLLIVLFDQSSSLILQVLMFLTVLIIFLHRANIARIINGTENKIKRE